MSAKVKWGHDKWIVSPVRLFYHIIPEKMSVVFWMCDFIALTRCCKLISFLYLIYTKVNVIYFGTNRFLIYASYRLSIVTFALGRTVWQQYISYRQADRQMMTDDDN